MSKRNSGLEGSGGSSQRHGGNASQRSTSGGNGSHRSPGGSASNRPYGGNTSHRPRPKKGKRLRNAPALGSVGEDSGPLEDAGPPSIPVSLLNIPVDHIPVETSTNESTTRVHGARCGTHFVGGIPRLDSAIVDAHPALKSLPPEALAALHAALEHPAAPIEPSSALQQPQSEREGYSARHRTDHESSEMPEQARWCATTSIGCTTKDAEVAALGGPASLGLAAAVTDPRSTPPAMPPQWSQRLPGASTDENASANHGGEPCAGPLPKYVPPECLPLEAPSVKSSDVIRDHQGIEECLPLEDLSVKGGSLFMRLQGSTGAKVNDPKTLNGTETVLSMHCALRNQTQLSIVLRRATHQRGCEHSPNERDPDGGRYPLHWAAARGHVKCVQMLLEAGARADVCDANGRTPADLALQYLHFEAHAMLEQGLACDEPVFTVKDPQEAVIIK